MSGTYHGGAANLAAPARELGRLDALPAAPLARVMGEQRALAVSRVGDDEQFAVRIHDVERHDLVVAADAHAGDPGRRTTHGPHVGLPERDRHAASGYQDELVLSGRRLHRYDFVV